MTLTYINTHYWSILWICLSISILSYWVMAYYSSFFKYEKWTTRKFSIFDLEFPSSARYYTFIMISLIDQSKNRNKSQPINSLRKNLYWDFLFMIGTYTFLAILALHVYSLDIVNRSQFFLYLAYAQLVALLLDIIENIFIFVSTYHPKLFMKPADKNYKLHLSDFELESNWKFKIYKLIVKSKFFIALTGLILSLFTILYSHLFLQIYTSISVYNGIFMFIAILLLLGVGVFISTQKQKT